MDPASAQQLSNPAWLEIAKSFGVPGVVAAIVSGVLRSSENRRIAENNRQIEFLRSDFRRVEEMTKIKLTLLQKKRVDAILELYKLVAQVDELVRFDRSETTYFSGSEPSQRIAGYERLHEYRLRVGELGVLFPEAILEKLVRLVDELARQYILTAMAAGSSRSPIDPRNLARDSDASEERTRRLSELDWTPLHDLIKSVRIDMREMLGELDKPSTVVETGSTVAASLS